jgi:hypothetical protein
MPHKQVTFRAAARETVLDGATALADAVRVTEIEEATPSPPQPEPAFSP